MIKFGEILPLIAALLVVLPLLQACDMYEESKLNQNRIQVESTHFSVQKSLAEMDKAYIEDLAQQYRRTGDGPVHMTIAYDPKSRKNTAMYAANEMARLSHDFKKSGMQDLKPQIIPVQGQGDVPTILVNFDSYTAKPPEDCDVMAGYDDREIEAEIEYGLGCTVETVFAKQISRPKDLKGQGNVDGATDGRRSSNRIEAYRTGVPNEPIGGESSSGN